MDDATRDRIKQTIESSEVVLFMKGDRSMPRCGFSARVIEILDSMVPDYRTIDVLGDAAVRDGIKEYSSWPTIPQLYVHGEFVGGCDIVTELFQTGELATKLGAESTPVEPPDISVTERAAEALRGALEDDADHVRLEVSPRFEHGLSLGPRQASDLEVDAGGLTLLVDRLSARRANGVRIDYVETPSGPAFKIDNPNEPARVQAMSAQALKQKLDERAPMQLVDVRTPEERELARVEGSRLLDQELADELLTKPRDTELVFICHTGVRSQQAAEYFLSQGFSKVSNVVGGIDAWSTEVDPDVPRY
jgi:monothiol glutaredoxin